MICVQKNYLVLVWPYLNRVYWYGFQTTLYEQSHNLLLFSTCYRSYFANSSGNYNKLGPFKYKPEDFSQPIHLKYDEYYVYVGQFKLANNTLHGIGIRVSKNGLIEEGYWKDGKQDGNCRFIRCDGSYYIGTLKAGCYSKGIEYKKDGSINQTYDR